MPDLPLSRVEATGIPGRGIGPGSPHELMLAVQDQGDVHASPAVQPLGDLPDPA